MENLRLYNEVEFFDTLNGLVADAKTGDRVVVSTMSIETSEPTTTRILNNLGGASLRGAGVCLAVDAYSNMRHRALGPINLDSPGARRQIPKDLVHLVNAGASVGIVNVPPTRIANLFTGRSHLKIFGVNDSVFIGGPSLHGTDRIDTVLGFTHHETADYLARLVIDLAQVGDTREVLGVDDTTREINKNTRLLIDAGVKKQSLILDKAIEAIDSADDFIVLSTQFTPDTAIMSHLEKALKRDVDIKLIINNPANQERFVAIHRLLLASKQRKFSEGLFANITPSKMPKVHSKVLFTESTAMIGSHNFIYAGVKAGTPEICVVIDDPEVSGLFAAKFLGQLLMGSKQKEKMLSVVT